MSWKRPNILQRMQVFLRQIELKPESYILDVGTADGIFSKLSKSLWPKSKIIRMDIQRFSQISESQEYIGTIQNLPHRSNTFSLIIAAQVLHYIPYVHHQSTIKKLHQQLGEKGTLAIVEYNTDKPYPWLPYPIPEESLFHGQLKPNRVIHDDDKRRPKYAAHYIKQS